MGGCIAKQKLKVRKVTHNVDLELLSLDPDDIPLFTYNNQIKTAIVCDVYDGDTCTIIIKDNGEFKKFKLRMYGYDAPEMKPRLKEKNRQLIKYNAKLAKEALEEKVLNKIVRIEFMKEDKYGRLLGNMSLDGLNINQWMIENGYGYEYFGGTKKVNQ